MFGPGLALHTRLCVTGVIRLTTALLTLIGGSGDRGPDRDRGFQTYFSDRKWSFMNQIPPSIDISMLTLFVRASAN